ncbi:MAG: amidohydrolase/deacetylase family metallohydrolase [Chloroflexi bacterium]|nr:MAG: amidohydrolase/deacetylase family metallohydrolase [Chloroflexota bacterium]
MTTSHQYDLLLKNGHVIDPANNRDGKMDVAISGGHIAAVGPDLNPALAAQVVDVAGHYVTPGIVDIHVHVYHTREPEGLSVMADSHSFRSGVTTMVDTGTAGAKHFLHFKRTVIDRVKTRIFAYINIVDLGMLGDFEQDIRTMDPELAASIVLAYPDVCVGIKTAHYWTRQPFDEAHPPWAAVDRAVEAGNICQKPVMVDFWPRPPERSYDELILKKMRPGDIHTHVFAQQFPVLDDQGKPNPILFEARERGVIFDVGHGAGSFWFRNAQPAMEGGFMPDSISTDLHTGNVHGVVVDMQTTMNKLLNLGMPLQEVIYRSTVTPAREIGHPELGNLTTGAEADVAVFKLLTGEFSYVDCGRAKIYGDKKLECAMTLRAGKIVFDPTGLSMPRWQDAPEAYWRLPW